MNVKIRKERNYYLAYFIDSRRIIEVNKIGAEIIDLLFNEKKEIEKIVKNISRKHHIAQYKINLDVKQFLQELNQQLEPKGFNIVEQNQLTKPLGVELEITKNCNLRCAHCLQKNYDDYCLPTKKAKKIINLLSNINIFEISLIGGEPFLHPNLFEIVNYCTSKEIAINIVSNGTFVKNFDLIKKIKSISRINLIISLDGIGDTHDSIRGKGQFEHLNWLLKELKKQKISVEATTTLNSINCSEYKKIINYCDKIGIACNFNLFKPFKKEHQNLIIKPEKFFEIVFNLFELRRKNGYKIGLSNAAIVSYLMNINPRNECRATLSGLVIDCHGKMIPCPSLLTAGYYSYNKLPYIDENFLNTWQNHTVFKEFRKNGMTECQLRSFLFSRDVKGKDPYGITEFKKWIKKIK